MNMKKVFSKIRTQHRAFAQTRREIIALSNEALSWSKRAIFALHRDDEKQTIILLEQAALLFATAENSMKNVASLRYEGAHRAALEEYAEALLFLHYVQTGTIGAIEARAMDPMVYLAGLADATGEIVRYTVRQVTQGKKDRVVHARDTVEHIIEFMLELDATGYLRTKFDQAKGNLKRLEDLLYDVSLR